MPRQGYPFPHHHHHPAIRLGYIPHWLSSDLLHPPIIPTTLCEQICRLIKEGREVLLVTSGAVGIGRQLLSKQQRLSLSVREIVQGPG